ncbi:MAG: hypothetical protein LBG96_03135 [Tannerella sp.]|jgi:hypothetical protein|nr:hypothetical protein [Tannerella sp.]
MKRKETTKETTKKAAKEVYRAEKPKSKIALFWEKNPNGIGTIVNMRAVLK